MAPRANEVFYAADYHPIQAGSIDGTDLVPHDRGVYRALIARSTGLYDPTGDCKAQGDPYCTIFVGRLSCDTSEERLHEAMRKYGKIKSMRLVRHIVTGASRGYAFVEFESEKEFLHAYEAAHHSTIDGSQIIVDYNRQKLMTGWIPRRLGGGLGGHKESGQLRFGGRDRPFRAPLRNDIPREELKKLGIPVPPERYMSHYDIPSPPRRKSEPDRKSRHDQRKERDSSNRKRSSHNRGSSTESERWEDSYRKDKRRESLHRRTSLEDDKKQEYNSEQRHRRSSHEERRDRDNEYEDRKRSSWNEEPEPRHRKHHKRW